MNIHPPPINALATALGLGGRESLETAVIRSSKSCQITTIRFSLFEFESFFYTVVQTSDKQTAYFDFQINANELYSTTVKPAKTVRIWGKLNL